jgi:hypothetical protein
MTKIQSAIIGALGIAVVLVFSCLAFLVLAELPNPSSQVNQPVVENVIPVKPSESIPNVPEQTQPPTQTLPPTATLNLVNPTATSTNTVASTNTRAPTISLSPTRTVKAGVVIQLTKTPTLTAVRPPTTGSVPSTPRASSGGHTFSGIVVDPPW